MVDYFDKVCHEHIISPCFVSSSQGLVSRQTGKTSGGNDYTTLANPVPTAIEINLPRPQVLPAVSVSLDVGIASTIPEETELIHVTIVVTVEL